MITIYCWRNGFVNQDPVYNYSTTPHENSASVTITKLKWEEYKKEAKRMGIDNPAEVAWYYEV